MNYKFQIKQVANSNNINTTELDGCVSAEKPNQLQNDFPFSLVAELETNTVVTRGVVDGHWFRLWSGEMK